MATLNVPGGQAIKRNELRVQALVLYDEIEDTDKLANAAA